MNKKELQKYVDFAKEIDFIKRKYNQIGYFYNLLNNLEDLVFIEGVLFLEKETRQILAKNVSKKTKKRDYYLHRMYKKALQAESKEMFGTEKCMLEKLAYPTLIASHIKPFIKSDEDESYDVNNGLLLSRTIDSLFDLLYISFDDNGKMLFSKRLSTDVKAFWKNYQLDKSLLNEKRKTYLAYHRKLMKQKDIN